MIGDALKRFRGAGYSGKAAPATDADVDQEDTDSPDPSQKVRTLSLTDDEAQAFQDVKPGQDVACEVHGTINGDGSFSVLTVAPLNAKSAYGEDEADMASQVAQRVTPSVQISPS